MFQINLKQDPKHFYSETLKKRNKKIIKYYASPKFAELTPEMIDNSDYDVIIWSHGDTFYKLAEEYYGLASQWWIIAYFNQKPTEKFCNLGDQVLIPRLTNLTSNAVVSRPRQKTISFSSGY